VGTRSFEAEIDASELERTDTEPDAVILAFDRSLTYAKLERACLLLREGLPFYATNPDKVCPTEYGYIPDCGSMAALLHEATGRMPQFIGKPHPTMVGMALSKLGATPGSTAMVGDRVYTDMQMAYNAGIASILVLSGETRESDLEGLERKPDFVFPSVHELHRALKNLHE
jgi:NagD protein